MPKDDRKDVNIVKLLFGGCLEYQWPGLIQQISCLKLYCQHFSILIVKYLSIQNMLVKQKHIFTPKVL